MWRVIDYDGDGAKEFLVTTGFYSESLVLLDADLSEVRQISLPQNQGISDVLITNPLNGQVYIALRSPYFYSQGSHLVAMNTSTEHLWTGTPLVGTIEKEGIQLGESGLMVVTG